MSWCLANSIETGNGRRMLASRYTSLWNVHRVYTNPAMGQPSIQPQVAGIDVMFLCVCVHF